MRVANQKLSDSWCVLPPRSPARPHARPWRRRKSRRGKPSTNHGLPLGAGLPALANQQRRWSRRHGEPRPPPVLLRRRVSRPGWAWWFCGRRKGSKSPTEGRLGCWRGRAPPPFAPAPSKGTRRLEQKSVTSDRGNVLHSHPTHMQTHMCTHPSTQCKQACTSRHASKHMHAHTSAHCMCMHECTHACECTRCKHAHLLALEQICAGRRIHTQTCTMHTHAHTGSCSTVLCSRRVTKGPGHRLHAAISASSLSWSHTGLALSSLPPRSLSLSS